MHVSRFRGTSIQPNGDKDSESQRNAAEAEETRAGESVDDEIESLLVSLDEPVEPPPGQASPAAHRPERGAEKRSSSRGSRRPDNRFDPVPVVVAVGAAFVVVLITRLIING
jgi:hypothetical protein